MAVTKSTKTRVGVMENKSRNDGKLILGDIRYIIINFKLSLLDFINAM